MNRKKILIIQKRDKEVSEDINEHTSHVAEFYLYQLGGQSANIAYLIEGQSVLNVIKLLVSK